MSPLQSLALIVEVVAVMSLGAVAIFFVVGLACEALGVR